MTLKIAPYFDRSRRVCIQVDRSETLVKFITLEINLGLEVHVATPDSFDQRFTLMEDYPKERACQLFANYSQAIGATKEAMEYLGQVINVSKKDVDMAVERNKLKAGAPVVKAKPVKTLAPKKDKPVKTSAPKKDEPTEKKPSAAQMFQDLIMTGKFTDNQIFEKVQASFGLDEKRRGYVKWYRNHLLKSGANPPEAKAS